MKQFWCATATAIAPRRQGSRRTAMWQILAVVCAAAAAGGVLDAHGVNYPDSPIPRTADSNAQPSCSVRLVVRDLAGVDARVLRRAENKAGDVLAAAGVRAVWIDVDAPTFGSDAPQWGIIVRRDLAHARIRDDSFFGVTPESAVGPGRLAYILWNHIRDTAISQARDASLLLGYAMAHEIGHLLLGSHSHSATGVMRAQWDRNDLTLVERGLLHFTPEEAQRIRRRLDSPATLRAGRR